MACMLTHNWAWPRRRGGKDIQICLVCGSERESKVRFDGPHYRKTQEGHPSPARALLHLQPKPQATAA